MTCEMEFADLVNQDFFKVYTRFVMFKCTAIPTFLMFDAKHEKVRSGNN